MREGRALLGPAAGLGGLAAVLACGSPSHPPQLGSHYDAGPLHDAAGGGSGSSSSSSGGGDDASPSGVTVSGTVLLEDSVSTPVAGVSLCVYQSAHCTRTAADGTFSLDGVPLGNAAITGSKSGLVTGLWPFTLASDLGGQTLRLRSPNTVGGWASELGVSGSGATVYFAIAGSGDIPLGVTVQAGGAAVGYLLQSAATGATPQVGPGLTYTTQQGAGLEFGLSDGTVDVTFAKMGITCGGQGAAGWRAMKPNTMTVPVQAGMLTLAQAFCR